MSDRHGWFGRPTATLDDAPGKPVLVLGNSLGTSTAVWDNQLTAFRQDFRLLRYELPGHGGAAAWPGRYTIAGLGGWLLGGLDSVGIDSFAYCGISLGAMIGMWLAGQVPDRVTALGLVCSSAHLPPAAGWLERAALVRTDGLAAVSAQVLSRWFTPAYAAAQPAVVAAFLAELQRTDPAGYAGCCEAIAAMDLRPMLPAITAPTLLIAGAADPATPPEHAAAIAGLIGAASLQVIPDAAHLACVSAPAQVTSGLLGLLRAGSSGTS